jgi:hypothetical protein
MVFEGTQVKFLLGVHDLNSAVLIANGHNSSVRTQTEGSDIGDHVDLLNHLALGGVVYGKGAVVGVEN